MATPESRAQQAYLQYQVDTMRRTSEILTGAGLTENDLDVFVEEISFDVVSRSEAAITELLHENEIHDHNERTEEAVEEIYRTGVRLHALISFLGEAGIRLVATDRNDHTQYINVGTMGEVRDRNDTDRSMMSLLAEAVQDELEEGTVETEGLAGVTPEVSGTHAMHAQRVGMQAVHMAILRYEQELTHMEDGDIMNRGAQLFCIFASMQRAGLRFGFIDDEGYLLPIREDLNALVRTMYGDEGGEPDS